MARRKINRDKFSILETFLQSEGFEPYRMKNNQGFDFISQDGGKICIYDSGSFMFQGSPDRINYLEIFWEESCKFAVEGIESKPANLSYAYFLRDDQKGIVKKLIEELAQTEGIPLKPTADPNSQYQYTLINNQKNKVSITQYRTGKLVLRGKHSDLWGQITELISNSIGLVINTMVANVVYNEAFAAAVDHSGDEIEIINVVTTEDQARAEDWTKTRLNKCYHFLYVNDRNRVESSEALLLMEAPLKDYFGCVSGTIEALEGFIKKLLIEINAFTEEEILCKNPKCKWEFSHVVDFRTKLVTETVRNVLSTDTVIRSRQEDMISQLVTKLWNYRNPHFHSGPPNGGNPIPTLKKARSIHDEIVSLMRKAYETLETEIKS